jgi:uncharacterized protein (TIGR02266 family)
MTVDRRIETRQTVNLDFKSVDDFINEYVANISRSGVFIKSEEPLPVGTRVTLKFTVIMNDLETIEGVGEVVRTIEKAPGVQAGMGVVFISLTGYSRQLIERILLRPG